MRSFTIVLLLFIYSSAFGQKMSEIKAFKHHSVIVNNDTINYHSFSKKSIDSTKTLLIYHQGSSARSLYQSKKKDGRYIVGTVIPLDFNLLPDDYLFVIISKKGLPFMTELDIEFPIPTSYYEHQTLAYRTFQSDEVIKQLIEKHESPFEKIIALGHSEGSDVVAKLGTINKSISHFGYWSGGGNTQFIDFITFVRKKVDAGLISEKEAQEEISSIFKDLKKIMADPTSTDKFWAGKNNSYNRWSSYSEPPIDNLLQISKPLFVAIGTKDRSVALESAYLIPIEFIRKQKDNLTFKVYPDLDHGFGKEIEKGKFKEYMNDVFREFLDWVNEE